MGGMRVFMVVCEFFHSILDFPPEFLGVFFRSVACHYIRVSTSGQYCKIV
jgi:hypothetical protein